MFIINNTVYYKAEFEDLWRKIDYSITSSHAASVLSSCLADEE